MKEAYAVVGLQFGSEAKGNIAGFLAMNRQPDTVVHNWSPNAGHTVVTSTGRKLVHSMLPMSIISPSIKNVLIGPGAVVNIDSLKNEVDAARDILTAYQPRFVIHPKAAIVALQDYDTESAFVKIGSTMKGSAAAAIRRMERDPDSHLSIIGTALSPDILSEFLGYEVSFDESAYFEAIYDSELLAVEGCQGFSLSMYHGFYPYTTSRDTSVYQLLADCAVPRKLKVEVFGCIRPYPIRVANRFDADGKMVGTSGPCYRDQHETDWEALGLEPEFTTVTKLKRRVFTFSHEQVQMACHINGVDHLALSFIDYLTEAHALRLIDQIEESSGCPVSLISNGPSVDHVMWRNQANLSEMCSHG